MIRSLAAFAMTDTNEDLLIRAKAAYQDAINDPKAFRTQAAHLVMEARGAGDPEVLCLALRASGWAERYALEHGHALEMLNEAARIGDSIRKIDQFLRRTPLSIELVIVDDGSTDDTSKIVDGIQVENLRLLQNRQNHGKGYSVRQGVLSAGGTYVLFTDADLSAPIEEMNKLLDVAIHGRADVVIGSRAVDRRYIEKHQSRVRELGGMVFNLMVRFILGLRFHDTQCGFKLFHRTKTRRVFERLTTFGFGFDPEVLYVARKLGCRVLEVPVHWAHDENSKIRLVRDGARMAVDVFRIRWNDLRGRYSGR